MTTPNQPVGTTYTGPGAGAYAGSSGGSTSDDGTSAQDQARQRAATAADEARDTAGTAADQARQTAGTAAEESRHVAGVAKEQAQQVADEARHQARGLLDEAMSQVDEQSRTQRDRLVGALQTFSDDLDQMASQGGRPGMATDVARQVADQARRFGNRIDGREPSELLDEVRSFARRRPGTFLLGALAAGVVAGRLTRGAKDAQANDGRSANRGAQGTTQGTNRRGVYGTSSADLYDQPPGTATGHPTAGTGYPRGPVTEPTGDDLDPTLPTTPPPAAPGVASDDRTFGTFGGESTRGTL